MPTYEYECDRCHHRFEKFQSMSDDPVKRCPECKGPVRRLLGTGAGLIFKGKGFYTTDYRSREYRERARSESSGGSDSTAGGEGPATPAGKKSPGKRGGTGTRKKPSSSSSD